MISFLDDISGTAISFSNTYDQVIPQIDAGYKREKVFGWLELDSSSFSPDSCLFDVKHCEHGFTIQFWLKIHECDSKVSSSSNCSCLFVTT